MYQRKKENRLRSTLLRILVLCLPLALVLAMVTQTASAKTYVITDGSRVFTYTTNETNPEEVLDEAGLELTARDSYTTETDDSGTTITICRAQTVTVEYRGEITTIHTGGETVGSLLSALNITPEPEDYVSHDLSLETWDGMYICIQQVITRQESYTAAIPYETTYCYDASLAAGSEEILTQGRDGELLCTAEVTYVNGREVSRRTLEQTIQKNAVDALISVGTGHDQAAEAISADPGGLPVIGEGYILLPTGEVLTYTDTAQVRATAYTHTDAGCDFVTATGSTVHMGTVAVDPRYIPYGTRMFIIANDGSYVYGISEAEDCGGAIKGDRVDLYFPTYAECMEFGWRNCTIYFLG